MALNPYPNIINSTDFAIFDFVSSGKKTLKKRVRFELIDDMEQVYNLALCTLLDDGTEDCETASRNGDMVRILETVGVIALMYTEHYPLRKIYFTGSDNLRTRQYQLSIFSQLQSIINYFDIEGLRIESEAVELREPFKAGKNYSAFIFTRKSL